MVLKTVSRTLLALTLVGGGSAAQPSDRPPANEIVLATSSLYDSKGEPNGATVVWRARKGRVRVLDGFQVLQWCPVWNSLLLSRGTSIFRLHLKERVPEKLLDVGHLLPNILDSIPSDLIGSVDQSGKFVAVKDGTGVAIIDLSTSKINRRITESSIRRAIRQPLDANIWCCGLSFNSDGWIALSIPTKRWKDSSDGVGPAQCLVISPSGSMKAIGIGSPVAWIDSATVLCRFEDESSDGVCPELLSLAGTSPKLWRHWGDQVGWNGSRVLLARKGTIQVLDRRLTRRTAVVAFAESDFDVRLPLVGIPYAALTRRAQTANGPKFGLNRFCCRSRKNSSPNRAGATIVHFVTPFLSAFLLRK